MKNILILCDGTWNDADQRDVTNVKRMDLLVPRETPDGREQVVLYATGVGTRDKGPWLDRLGDKVLGGAFGWGLDDKIAAAYRRLGDVYEPGDRVHVMGFSRGAYTARSLVGLIRNAGLPRHADEAMLERAFAMYRRRDDASRPDTPEAWRLRLEMSPQIVTSPEELAWRRAEGQRPGFLFEVAYLGVWDTVGSLGIPAHWGLPASVVNRRHRFHDTELSRIVRSARHAVAVDERRRSFAPALWSNLAKLRAANPAGEFLQEWFAGDHGSVGGGGEITGLSHLTLIWIAAGAMRAGLWIAPDRLSTLAAAVDEVKTPLRNTRAKRSAVERAMALTAKWREAPGALAEVAHPAVRRWQGDADYRPRTLAPLAAELDGFDPLRIADYRTSFAAAGPVMT
jgi:uncharacterized protein (DUF2235 family)